MALPGVIKALLENGVHFGHLSKHWNPKMQKFIFGKKKNVYIIDLEKTAKMLAQAQDFVKDTSQHGGKTLFVATKKQLRALVKEMVVSCGMPYIVERWVGGFLTNFSTVRKRVERYKYLLEQRENGGFSRMIKKEAVKLNREIERMDKIYSGVIDLDQLPAAIFVVDPKKEVACVREANKLSIPVIALIDTDANPEVVDYPIPGNDDAIKSVRYILSCVVEAAMAGLKKRERLTRLKKESGQSEQEEEDVTVPEEIEIIDEKSAQEEVEDDLKKKSKKTLQPKEGEV